MKHIYIAKTSSTNEWAKLHLSDYPLPFSVQTDFQTAGKGQMKKTWCSNQGENLLFSLVSDTSKFTVENQFTISKIVAVSIIEVLERFNIEQLSIKWPNDIYYKNRKIAGILIENILSTDCIKASVIGIGLNVLQTVFPEEIPNPVSLSQIKEKAYSIAELKENISEQIIHNLKAFETIDEIYLNYLFRKGEIHTFVNKKQKSRFQGTIQGVAKDGALEIKNTITQQIERFTTGEISFVINNIQL